MDSSLGSRPDPHKQLSIVVQFFNEGSTPGSLHL